MQHFKFLRRYEFLDMFFFYLKNHVNMKNFFTFYLCFSFLLPSCSDNTVVVEQDIQAPSLRKHHIRILP